MNAPLNTLARRADRSTIARSIGAGAIALLLVLILAHALGTAPHAPGLATVGWTPAQEQDQRPEQAAGEGPGDSVPDLNADEPAEAQAQPDPAPGSPAVPAAPARFHARVVPVAENGLDPLGDVADPSLKTALSFTQLGAGIDSIKLPDEYETVEAKVHVTLQEEHKLDNSDLAAIPFAAISITIDGERVYLDGAKAAPVWAQLAPGDFEAFVDDLEGRPIVRIERRYTLKPDARHGFILEDTVENLTDEPITAQLAATGPIDMPKAKSSYGGDRRRIRYGYLLPEQQQGGSMLVTADDQLERRTKLLGKKAQSKFGKAYEPALQVWPNEETLPGAARLSWIAFADRYFVVAIHPHFDPESIAAPEEKLLSDIESIDRLVLDPYASSLDAVQVLRLVFKPQEIVPGASHTSTLGVYAGPRNRPKMMGEPEIAALNMHALVVSNLGGMCAPCTFSWLTDILIGVLRTFHSIVGDWAVSILLLVVLVRGCLHPVTRWSQIRVQRFSVQMQAMAPKQKAIREKYKDDSKRQQQEMTKLWKEQGISPAGMLGCLPMFLQSPVWIALYATLFYASELRHEPAFYGVFQHVFGWGFMNDLSAPDGAIPIPSALHFSFPLWGNVNSVNILPLLLGVVFYLHQKYLTPPTQATMTPEQESQQKMMKILMIFMFPVMMYAAPSGLALYFITNSTMGIIENKWIRAHMKKHGMLEIENIRAVKKDKGPGLLQRMNQAAELQKELKEKGPAQPNPASRHNRRGKQP